MPISSERSIMSAIDKPRSVSNSVLLGMQYTNLDSPQFPSSLAARKAANRTSVTPSTLPITDEYAQIIMQSRTAKMQKWKGSPAVGSTSAAATLDLASPFRPPIPSFESEADITDSQDQEPSRADPIPNIGTSSKEIEWVDWLDEYRRLKEAKLRSESEKQQEKTDAEMMPPPPLPLAKGKGKARNQVRCFY